MTAAAWFMLALSPIASEEGEWIVDTGTLIQRSKFDESQVTEV